MSLKLYMDVHVKYPITQGLRQRGIDVLTAQEDGTTQMSDSDLLTRASTLGRVLFSQDEDLLQETARRQQAGEPFAGLVFSRQLALTIGRAIADLELLATVYEPAEMANRVEYIPF